MTDNMLQIHLVSDSTANTLSTIVKSCLSHFGDIQVNINTWPLVSNKESLKETIDDIKNNTGLILYTFGDPELSQALEHLAIEADIQTYNLLEEPLNVLGSFLKKELKFRPGKKHKFDEDVIERIQAIEYALTFEDSNPNTSDPTSADVVLIGPSLTSKTPTCIYLANKGIKVANYTLFIDKPLPKEIFKLENKIIIGLIAKPERLVELRRNRLKIFDNFIQTDYLDENAVMEEVMKARTLYKNNSWPIIDVSNRAIEDVCKDIIELLNK